MAPSNSAVGWSDMKSTRWVLGHSLFRLVVRSHRSLICLLRTAHFACAGRYAHLLARLLTPSLRSSWERSLFSINWTHRFQTVSANHGWLGSSIHREEHCCRSAPTKPWLELESGHCFQSLLMEVILANGTLIQHEEFLTGKKIGLLFLELRMIQISLALKNGKFDWCERRVGDMGMVKKI